MRQREGNMKYRATEPDDSDAVPINKPTLIKFVDGAFECCHAPRSFLRCVDILTVFARCDRISDLQDHDSFGCQRLCRERTVPGPIHPESLRVVAVGLNHEGIASSLLEA